MTTEVSLSVFVIFFYIICPLVVIFHDIIHGHFIVVRFGNFTNTKKYKILQYCSPDIVQYYKKFLATSLEFGNIHILSHTGMPDTDRTSNKALWKKTSENQRCSS